MNTLANAFILLISIYLLSGGAFAQAQTEDVDQTITNTYLRALSGSKSKFSFASTWNYLGGTVASPFSESRPNIADASATTPKTDIEGSLNVKYNLNPRNALLLGFGVRWISPFSLKGPSDYSGTRFDAVNPSLTYQYLYGFSGFQAVLQVEGMQYTQADVVALGFAEQVQIDQETMFEIGQSGVTLALSFVVDYNFFSDSLPLHASQQSQYQIDIAPYIEYKLNDTYNLRTVSNLFIFEHYRSGPAWTRDIITQSVGLGVSLTRDIFLYPNVQFLPQKIATDLTNVGVQANINLF